jgi:peptidoglycan/LPS O-acetylase OafA/YrhL
MWRQLIGWTAAICMLIAFALGGADAHNSALDVIGSGAVILLMVIIAIVSWQAFSEPTRRVIKRRFRD